MDEQDSIKVKFLQENSMKSNYTFAMANSPLTLINSWKKIMTPLSLPLPPKNLENLKGTYVDQKRHQSFSNHDLIVPKRLSNWRTQLKQEHRSFENQSSFQLSTSNTLMNGHVLSETKKSLENQFGLMNVNLSLDELKLKESRTQLELFLDTNPEIDFQYSCKIKLQVKSTAKRNNAIYKSVFFISSVDFRNSA
jgi:hypothetical protein